MGTRLLLFLTLSALVISGCRRTSTEPELRQVVVVRVEPSSVLLAIGDTVRLTATPLDDSGAAIDDLAVSWTSLEEGVAMVVDGLVTAVGPGEVAVRASVSGQTGRSDITVSNPPATSVTIDADSVALAVGFGGQLQARAFDGEGAEIAVPLVSWSSLGPDVVTVTQTGVVRAQAPGTTSVVARVDGVADTVPARVGVGAPGLSVVDSGIVARAMSHMAETGDWPYPAVVDSAHVVMSKTDYDATHWGSFFRGELLRQRWNWNLYNWIGYPILFWQPEPRRAVLQAGLVDVLADELMWSYRGLGAGLGAALAADPTLKEHLLMANRFFEGLLQFGVVPGADTQVADRYEQLIEAVPEYLTKVRVEGADREIGVLRAHAWVRLVEASRRDGRGTGRVPDVLDLTGLHRSIFDEFGILLVDNLGLSTRQLTVIRDFVGALPREFADFTCITVWDHFANTTFAPNSLDGCVNIFGVAVGQPGQPFPRDITSRTSDTFTEVLAHEITHIINAIDVANDQRWYARHLELIERAGDQPMNYLRSMIPAGFFIDAPQEFLASIGNQWFTDSEHTLRLGRQRFAQGRPEPLNQALFFADVMSLHGTETRFYRHTPSGVVFMERIPLERDENGFITRIQVGDSVHAFVRDADGNTLGTWSEPPP